MLVKAIFRANLQFGNTRSYELAVQTFHRTVEQLYKGEVCIKAEEVFDEATYSFAIPYICVTTLEKTIKNTAYLMRALSEFAQSGKGYCWILESGKALFTMAVEPTGEKTSIQYYLAGKQLAKEPGNEQRAIEELTKAIKKFPPHWTAYERRGYVHGLLGEFDKAVADFDKSLAINNCQSDAYFSRARVNMMQKNYAVAIADFDACCKNANPQQPLYWASRRMKAESCMKLGHYAEACKEYSFYSKPVFTEDNPNYAWSKTALLNYSFCLSKLNDEVNAKANFIKAYKSNNGIEPIVEGDLEIFYNKMLVTCNLSGNGNGSSKSKLVAI
jgi:Tetratricopeptide repeat